MTRCCSLEPQRREFNRVSLIYPMDSMKRFAQDVYKRHDRAFALHSTNDEALAPWLFSAWSREFFLAAVCTCDLVHVPVVQNHWQDDLTLSSRLRLKKFPRSAGRCSTDAFSGSPNGRTLVTTAKTGCLSSPLVMNPRLSAKERSKSTGWASSTVICVRGCGPGVLFSIQNRLYLSNRLLFCRQNAGL